MKILKQTLAIFLLCFFESYVYAYDFKVGNVMYNIISDNEVETAPNDDVMTKYSIYSGKFVVPANVTYNNKEYTVTRVGSFTGWNSGIESIELPKTVRTICSQAFTGSRNLKKISMPGVYDIEFVAFSSCTRLSSVTLPESLRSIGEGAFSGCLSWKDVVIPDSVTFIGDRAFEGNGIESVILGESVEVLGEGSFCGCAIKSIIIPKNVSVIRPSLFSFCDNLESIIVEDGNPVFDSRNNCNAIIETNTNKIVAGCKKTIIPEGVVCIGNGAFSGIPFRSIGPVNMDFDLGIPHTVTEITDRAFEDPGSTNKALRSVLIPKSLKRLGYRAFYGALINTLEFEEGACLEEIGSQSFCGCPIEEVKIPEKVGLIDDGAFGGTSLRSVIIESPSFVLNSYSFNNCSMLKSLTLKGGFPCRAVDNAFMWPSQNEIDLIVPRKTAAFYKKAEVWKDFRTISESDELPVNPVVYINDTTISAGLDIAVPINLINNKDVGGFQFDLNLPRGVSVKLDDSGKPIVSFGTRSSARRHTIEYDGKTIVCYSQVNKPFEGNEGAAFYLTLHVGDNVENGEYEVTMSDIAVSCLDNSVYTAVEMKSALYVNAETYALGDSNGDGNIDVADISNVVGRIMSYELPRFYMQSSDVNMDNIINVADIQGILGIILHPNTNKNTNRSKMFTRSSEDAVSLYVEPFTITAGEEMSINVNLSNNDEDVAGVQFDLILPEGLSVVKEFGEFVIDPGGRVIANSHNIASSEISDGTIRAVLFSSKNNTLDANDGDIAHVLLNADNSMVSQITDLNIKNIIVARTNGTKIICKDMSFEVKVDENANYIESLKTNESSDNRMTNILGIEISDNFHGIVIKNGKKVYVK